MVSGRDGCNFNWILPVSTCDIFNSSLVILSNLFGIIQDAFVSSCCSEFCSPTLLSVKSWALIFMEEIGRF